MKLLQTKEKFRLKLFIIYEIMSNLIEKNLHVSLKDYI